jgi:hypothetical protein
MASKEKRRTLLTLAPLLLQPPSVVQTAEEQRGRDLEADKKGNPGVGKINSTASKGDFVYFGTNKLQWPDLFLKMTWVEA